MMEIKHFPSGLFPTFDSAFERRPHCPISNEVVSLGCRIDGVSEYTSVSVDWTFDGVEMPAVIGVRQESNTAYFSFRIQLPAEPANVKYRFTAVGKEAVVTSKWYEFETTKLVVLENPTKTVLRKDSVSAFYDVGEHHFIFRLNLNESAVNIALSAIPNDFDDTEFQPNITSAANFTLENGDVVHTDERNLLSIKRNGTEIFSLGTKIGLWLDRNGAAYQSELSFNIPAGGFYGFGEKFDRVNQKDLSPLSYVIEKFTRQEDKAYIPIPFFHTETGLGFLAEGTYRTQFFTEQSGVRVLSNCPQKGKLFGAKLFTGTPDALLRKYIEFTGKATLPPKWAFGPWMSSNGWNTEKEALEQVDRMNELSIPATVMVLEAWSDEETFYIWNDAKYAPKDDGGAFTYADFTFPQDGKWPNPKRFVETLNENGLKLILWQIPVIKYTEETHGAQLDFDEEYAISNGLCVKNADGSPYRITEMWFGNSLIPDFSSSDTFKWWFDKRRYLLDELGVSGFKTDGGEFLFDTASRLSDGRDIAEAHNDFPNIYVGAYHRFMNEVLGDGKGVTFSRAGYTGAQKYPIHWAGDQVSEFSELRGQLSAGLSLGLSGVPFWSFDLGGFAGELPSTELYLRGAAFAAFSPVMQFHSEPRSGQYEMNGKVCWNNDRSPWNMAQANNAPIIIDIYRLYANIRMKLLPYLWREARFCADTARPMMAHLLFDYPNDPKVWALDDEYMLGRDLLVAPVTEEGANGRNVYLPKGSWYDFWTNKRVDGEKEFFAECGLDRIPVYVRENSALPLNLGDSLTMGGTGAGSVISNSVESFQNLCFRLYGDTETAFDDCGYAFTLSVNGTECVIDGNFPDGLIIASDAPIKRLRINGEQIERSLAGSVCRDIRLPYEITGYRIGGREHI